jgi:hypothetical protein
VSLTEALGLTTPTGRAMAGAIEFADLHRFRCSRCQGTEPFSILSSMGETGVDNFYFAVITPHVQLYSQTRAGYTVTPCRLHRGRVSRQLVVIHL